MNLVGCEPVRHLGQIPSTPRPTCILGSLLIGKNDCEIWLAHALHVGLHPSLHIGRHSLKVVDVRVCPVIMVAQSMSGQIGRVDGGQRYEHIPALDELFNSVMRMVLVNEVIVDSETSGSSETWLTPYIGIYTLMSYVDSMRSKHVRTYF